MHNVGTGQRKAAAGYQLTLTATQSVTHNRRCVPVQGYSLCSAHQVWFEKYPQPRSQKYFDTSVQLAAEPLPSVCVQQFDSLIRDLRASTALSALRVFRR